MTADRIEREIFIEAAPAVVFEVVSSPEHLRHWWPDDADFEPVAGSSGRITFGDPDRGGAVAGFAVVEARAPRLFSFRWTHPVDQAAVPGNSLLVTFELIPSDGGTRLRMTETGFREMDWELQTLEAQYADHETGWDHFLPRLVPYVAGLTVRR